MNKLYTILCFLSGLFFFTDAGATHLVGGSMSYEYLGLQNNGNYRYRITIKMYRDCAASTVPFDDEIDVGFYNNNSERTLSKILTVPKITEIPVDPPSGGSNCSFQPNVCIRQAIYQGIVDLSASTLGYHLIFRRCCRNTQQNIIDDMGQTYYAFIPNTSINNSSPFFTEVPAPYICRNDLVSIYNTAKDKDGDSLVYELNTPWSGGSEQDPMPGLPFNMPAFENVIYRSNFNVNIPFGNSGVANIDKRNGVTEIKAPGLGRYSIAIDVSEYRNGVLISKIRLDIQMIVIDCPPNAIPDIKTQTNTLNYTVKEGEPICFDVIGTDSDNDNIKLKGTGVIFDGIMGSKATFVEKSGKGSVTSQFCWTPPCGSARSTPYPATFEVNDDGCPAKKKLININIKVDPFVGVGLISGPSPICADLNGVVYSAAGQAGSTYEWVVTGGVIVSGQGTNSITVDWDNVAAGLVEVKEVNMGGCEGQTVKKNIILLPAPIQPTITGPDTVCELSNGNIYSITATPNYTYNWTVSGGNLTSGANTAQISVNWLGKGNGFIRVTQSNSSGCTSEPDTFRVNIVKNEIDSLLGSPSVCPHSVQIDYYVQTPDPMATYIWTVDQGTQVAGANGPAIKVNWGEPANGYVEVYEINKFGCRSDAIRMNVSIDHNLTGMKPLEEDTLCEFSSGIPYRVIFTNKSTYYWSVSGGSFVQNDSSEKVIVDWGASGNASIAVSERAYDSVNNKACVSPPQVLDVFLAPVPANNPIIGLDELCQSATPELYFQNGFPNSTYKWTFSGGTFTNQGNDSIYILPVNSGNFDLTVIETSQYGCVGPLNLKSIIIHPKPVTAGIDGDPIICYPRYGSRPYEVQGFPTSTYNWTFDGGNISSGQGTQQVVLDFNGQAINQIYVQEISDFGCPGDTLHLEVFADRPSLELEVVSVKLGDDSKMEVTWNLINAPRYNSSFLIQRRTKGGVWVKAGITPNGTTFFTDFGLNTDANDYDYRIVGFNLCGDSIYSNIHRHVRIVGAKPEDDPYAVRVDWSRYMGFNDGVERYELYRKEGHQEFVLQRDAGLDTFDYYDDGTKTFQHCYRVKTIENVSGTVSWSNEICFGFDPLLFVPTAFTPNGDFINDQFTWYHASIRDFSIQIYDRWGERIYEADHANAYWDANYRGVQVPEGVYVFIINYTGYDGRLQVVKGNLTILR